MSTIHFVITMITIGVIIGLVVNQIRFENVQKRLLNRVLSLKEPIDVAIHLAEGAILPTKATDSAGAYDVYANLIAMQKMIDNDTKWAMTFLKNAILVKAVLTIKPGGQALIPTGIHTSFNPNYKINIRPRSGLSAKSRISMGNTPGLIDADYRGDIGVILMNTGTLPITIKHEDRIAQMEIIRNEHINFNQVDSITALGDTNRGDSGFGSTGLREFSNTAEDNKTNEVSEQKYETTNADLKITAGKIHRFDVSESKDNLVVGNLNNIQYFVLKLIAYRKLFNVGKD